MPREDQKREQTKRDEKTMQERETKAQPKDPKARTKENVDNASNKKQGR